MSRIFLCFLVPTSLTIIAWCDITVANPSKGILSMVIFQHGYHGIANKQTFLNILSNIFNDNHNNIMFLYHNIKKIPTVQLS